MAEHRVPLYCLALIRPGSLPKTSSGKIQRARLADMIRAGQLRDRVVDGDAP